MLALGGNIRRIIPTCSKMLMSSSFKCWTRINDKERNASLAIKDNGDCQCIAHRDFYGPLRSNVTCASCGFTSTTHDPCMDISLYLSACNSSRKDFGSKFGKPSESLVGCLDLFT
ncbi:hypothetical protein AABB24_014381 [Solanum stoloniferum]|uniref:Uncharacterized protein n=1 Tax=Solanum stoloniferum TaxID=62892 RepID=A0ABD2TYU0_9SOLN